MLCKQLLNIIKCWIVTITDKFSFAFGSFHQIFFPWILSSYSWLNPHVEPMNMESWLHFAHKFLIKAILKRYMNVLSSNKPLGSISIFSLLKFWRTDLTVLIDVSGVKSILLVNPRKSGLQAISNIHPSILTKQIINPWRRE